MSDVDVQRDRDIVTNWVSLAGGESFLPPGM
jgi:hypothetical protein